MFGQMVPGGGFNPPNIPSMPALPGMTNAATPEAPQAPQAPASPFGGDQAQGTQDALSAFRNQAKGMGLAVDAGDEGAYAQMQKGFGGLSPVEGTNVMSGMGSPVSGFQNKLEGYLDKVLSGGGNFDDKLVKARHESIKDALDRSRQGLVKQNRANLANRGMLSVSGAPSGVEASSLEGLDARLGADYATGLRDIYSNEQQAASGRFMDALGLGVNRENNLLQNAIAQANQSHLRDSLALDRDRFGADSAFRQAGQLLESQLGLGRLQLDRDVADSNTAATNAKSIDQIIQDIINATNTSTGGYY